jgi:anti-sigma regulatory factor (Ser/Thr protein kinase)
MMSTSVPSSRLHFRFAWPATVNAAGAARRALEVLPLQGAPERLDDLRLLVSEVVTNAVVHTGPQANQSVEMRVEMAPDRTRVEVRDKGPGFEPTAAPEPRAVGGMGMVLVDRLSRRWGIGPGPDFGIWFELEAGYRARSHRSATGAGRDRAYPEAWERLAS